jgi:hypothetical protein
VTANEETCLDVSARPSPSGACRPVLAPGLGAAAQAEPADKPAAQDNEELSRLFREDQDDRKPAEIDWSVVEPRDRQREARVLELYKGNQLQSGADHYHAATVLQYGRTPEDYLLAHELCVVAVGKGRRRCRSRNSATGCSAARPTRQKMSRSRGPPSRFRHALALRVGRASAALWPGVSSRSWPPVACEWQVQSMGRSSVPH